ncbi:unnamed protein product [Victoria cruziana]
MWQLSIGGDGSRELYPERPGESDCPFYMRTGFCGYGASCRFNHPGDRNLRLAVLGEYPERVGEPVCQYFLKTGTCKFGATCKFHHPKNGSRNALPVNYLGYPLRPGEKDCNYYMKTGLCKFGITCKFHHPQPAGTSLPTPAPAFYSTVQSPSLPSSQPYGAGVTGWQVARPPMLPSSYVQGSYAPVILHPGVVPFPSWSSYPSPIAPLASPGTQHPAGTGPLYGLTHQLSPSAPAFQEPFYSSTSAGGPLSSQKENIFPERPGQPECQFYIKTGDCKFGSSCRYHHPRDQVIPKTSHVLSPVGLPLRPGAPICTFYAQNGVCKFGPTCKFDHPMGSYRPSSVSVGSYPVGLSIVTVAPTSSASDFRAESMAGLAEDSLAVSESQGVRPSKVGQVRTASGHSTASPNSSIVPGDDK